MHSNRQAPQREATNLAVRVLGWRGVVLQKGAEYCLHQLVLVKTVLTIMHAHLTGSSVCATMSSSVDSSTFFATKSGWCFSPKLWVSKSCCCEPVLTWPSSSCACVHLPSCHPSVDLTPSSDTVNSLQRASPCNVQTPQETRLWPDCLQEAYLKPSGTPETWPTVHPSLRQVPYAVLQYI